MSAERAIPNAADWPQLSPHHLPRYLLAATLSAGRRVLDAGCGAGYGAALLKSPSVGKAAHVVAVDIDAASVGAAQDAFAGVEFLVDDCHDLQKVSGPFDLICNFENIEHLQHPERFLAAAARRLAPEGLLLVSTPDRAATPPFKNGRPDNPFHVIEWNAGEFVALLERFFQRVELRVQVESHAHRSRLEALRSLRQGMFWSSPLLAFLWRKAARTGGQRSWKVLEGLITPSLADYPIVEVPLAGIWGKPAWHMALCREPRNAS